MSDRPALLTGRLTCVVHGTVQGVGFRWFVREHARRLGLAGVVRNQSDGTVGVRAEGAVSAIAALRALLYEGPPGASVSHVTEEHPESGDLPHPFTILR